MHYVKRKKIWNRNVGHKVIRYSRWMGFSGGATSSWSNRDKHAPVLPLMQLGRTCPCLYISWKNHDVLCAPPVFSIHTHTHTLTQTHHDTWINYNVQCVPSVFGTFIFIHDNISMYCSVIGISIGKCWSGNFDFDSGSVRSEYAQYVLNMYLYSTHTNQLSQRLRFPGIWLYLSVFSCMRI